MKTNFKRICSFVLAFAMIISLLPHNVYAEEISTPTDPAIIEDDTEEDTSTIDEEVKTEEDLIVFDHMYSDVDVSNIKTNDLSK